MTAFPYDIKRSDWEQPGKTIAEHTGSPPLDWSKIHNVTIHYPGTPSTITAESATRDKFISNLRNSQSYYITERGYSYGYNAAVWGPLNAEIRGDAFRCAANGETATNTPSFAIQVRAGGIGDDSRPASAEEIDSIRAIVAWAEQQAGRPLEILGHRDHKSTSCPGGPIYAQIQAGAFRPLPTDPPPPGPTTPPKGDPMQSRGLVIRLDGFADQMFAIPIGNVEQLNKMGITEPPVVVSTDKSRAELEAELGYQLTPLP